MSRPEAGFRVHTGQFVRFSGIFRSPFPLCLADNQRPLVSAGNGEDRVAARGNVSAALDDVGRSDEGGCFAGAGAQEFYARQRLAKDFAAAYALDYSTMIVAPKVSADRASSEQ